MAGIYLHIPFCRQACHYCDFHFSTNLKLRNDMIKAMGQEIVLRGDYLTEKVETIYFGGGTPSLLEAEELEYLLNVLYKEFHIEKDVEITLEANPDDLADDKLQAWRSLGINRLSIGIQTFDDNLLRYLNRAHNSKEALDAIDKARYFDFENFSIDLIYALPASNHLILLNDLKIATALSPNHISAYNLTIEPETVFGRWLKKGTMVEMTDDFATEQYWHLVNGLQEAGYEHYEVSNFALPGFQSKHNTSYWKGIPYLGIGPGAHSFNGTTRQHNKPNNPIYIKSLSKGEVPSQHETLSSEDHINEYLLTGLRTSWGIDLNYLNQILNYSFSENQERLINTLVENEQAILDKNSFILTGKGFLLADQIALELSV